MAKKREVTSLRLSQKEKSKFRELCNYYEFTGTDFMRECIKKFCEDNNIILDNRNKKSEIIESIKEKLSESNTKNIIKIKNGKIETLSETTIYCLADLLFAFSKNFFDLWREVCEKYKIIFYDEEDDDINEFILGERFLEFTEAALLSIPQKQKSEPETLLSYDTWGDVLECKTISLILALRNALEKYGARNLIEEIVQKVSVEERKPQILLMDAKGTFKISSNKIVSPTRIVDKEKV